MIRRPPRSTPLYSSAASDVYKETVGTLLSTITINTRGKDVMLAVLFIPLMFPLLWACVSATTGVLVGGEEVMETFTTSMALAGGYDVIMILVSWVLYDFVVSA